MRFRIQNYAVFKISAVGSTLYAALVRVVRGSSGSAPARRTLEPLATCVRTIMGERGSWTGSASDLLRLCAETAREDAPPWAKNPRALAGRLRRAQTFLRMLDMIEFGREGRLGARMIRMSALGSSRSRAVGMDLEDEQNAGCRLNGGEWPASASSTRHGCGNSGQLFFDIADMEQCPFFGTKRNCSRWQTNSA